MLLNSCAFCRIGLSCALNRNKRWPIYASTSCSLCMSAMKQGSSSARACSRWVSAIHASVLVLIQLEQGIFSLIEQDMVRGESGICPPLGHEKQRVPTDALYISQHHRDCLCVSFILAKALSHAGYTEDPNCVHDNWHRCASIYCVNAGVASWNQTASGEPAQATPHLDGLLCHHIQSELLFKHAYACTQHGRDLSCVVLSDWQMYPRGYASRCANTASLQAGSPILQFDESPCDTLSVLGSMLLLFWPLLCWFVTHMSHTWAQLIYRYCMQLWDARQTCCAAVHSFPRFPDLLAISSCVVIADAPQDVADDRSFRTHKVEMKKSPRFTHRLLASS